LTTVEALYQGIEASWNYKFEEAIEVFSAFSEKGDVRHQLHQIELNIFKVLITGKKSQIDQCTQKISKYEEALLQTKSSMQRQKQQSLTIDHKPRLNMGSPRPKTRFLVSEDIN